MAEDAFQETLMQVRDDARLFHPQGPDPGAGARRWLKRVATTTSLQLLRRCDRAVRRDRAMGIQTAALCHEDPAAALAGAEEIAALRLALSGLAEPRRTAIALHHLQGLPLNDVAVALNRPLGTVKTWIHRGMAELQTVLAGRGVVLSVGGLVALCSTIHAASAGSVLPAPVARGASSLLDAGGTASIKAIALTSLGGLAMSAQLAVLIILAASAVVVPLSFAREDGGGASPPPVVPAVAPAVMPAPTGLDTVLDDTQETFGTILKRVGDSLDRVVVCDEDWIMSGQEQARPFPLAGSTGRHALDAFGKATGQTWIEHEGKIVFLTPTHLAQLRAEIVVPTSAAVGVGNGLVAGPQALAHVLPQLARQSGLIIVFSGGRLAWPNGLPQIDVPAGRFQAAELLTELMRRAGLQAVWGREGWYICRRPAARILPTDCRERFCLNGIDRTATERFVDMHLVDVPASQAYAALARLIGAVIEVDAEVTARVTLPDVKRMRAHYALDFIDKLADAYHEEIDGRLVVRPRNKPNPWAPQP